MTRITDVVIQAGVARARPEPGQFFCLLFQRTKNRNASQLGVTESSPPGHIKNKNSFLVFFKSLYAL